MAPAPAQDREQVVRLDAGPLGGGARRCAGTGRRRAPASRRQAAPARPAARPANWRPPDGAPALGADSAGDHDQRQDQRRRECPGAVAHQGAPLLRRQRLRAPAMERGEVEPVRAGGGDLLLDDAPVGQEADPVSDVGRAQQVVRDHQHRDARARAVSSSRLNSSVARGCLRLDPPPPRCLRFSPCAATPRPYETLLHGPDTIYIVQLPTSGGILMRV